jgi:hypothetical protein
VLQRRSGLALPPMRGHGQRGVSMTKWHQSNGHEGREIIRVNPGSSPFRMWMVLVPIMLLMAQLSGCSGKKRPFSSEPLIDDTASDTRPGIDGREGSSEPLAGDDAVGNESQTGQESENVPGSFIGSSDGGSDESALSTSMATCGDDCSGECTPGATECASLTEKIECGIDALWGQPVACDNVCLDGACAGECLPGASECVSTTRFRSCSELGTWSEPADCENACVGAACGGECTPGETRCASTTSVQTCDDQGQWGQTTGCQNACAGNACTGECMPGTTRCSSETQLQRCSDQGQFLTPTACQFACVNGSCGGECSPGSGRCNPANGTPQVCSGTGIWQSQGPCPFVCSGSGSCSGECTPGSRRCSPASGIPQLCSTAGTWQNQAACQFACTGSGACGGECTPGSRRCSPASGIPQLCSTAGAWQNQTACPFVCTGNGACGGECTPGSRRCDPASGAPQLCSNAGAWQSQAACARGCQSGSCIPQLGPGLACGAARDCASGFCVDGVCCQSQCGGVCAQCEAGTGACITPATDPECDPVICASNDCRVSGGNITSNLCKARGQCKNQNDCNFSNFDRGTQCDTGVSDHRICDGSGRCIDPTVACNGVSGRPVGEDNVCCVRREGGTASETYTSAASCAPPATPVTCDGDEDCRSGTVCCGLGAGSSFVGCVSTSVCNTSGPSFSYYEVCASPSGFSDDCPSGTVCRALPNFLPQGWAQCTPPL